MWTAVDRGGCVLFLSHCLRKQCECVRECIHQQQQIGREGGGRGGGGPPLHSDPGAGLGTFGLARKVNSAPRWSRQKLHRATPPSVNFKSCRNTSQYLKVTSDAPERPE